MRQIGHLEYIFQQIGYFVLAILNQNKPEQESAFRLVLIIGDYILSNSRLDELFVEDDFVLKMSL